MDGLIIKRDRGRVTVSMDNEIPKMIDRVKRIVNEVDYFYYNENNNVRAQGKDSRLDLHIVYCDSIEDAQETTGVLNALFQSSRNSGE